jgi:hypothetical protein
VAELGEIVTVAVSDVDWPNVISVGETNVDIVADMGETVVGSTKHVLEPSPSSMHSPGSLM